MVSPVAALDKLEEYLSKFEDGPFFLGHEFSLVCFSFGYLFYFIFLLFSSHAEFVPYKIILLLF